MNTEIDTTQTPVIEKPKRKRRLWLRILLTLLILLSGIIIGAGGTAIAVRRTVQVIVEHPEDIPEMMTRNMKRQLKLSEEQAKKIQAILDIRITNVRNIMKEVRPLLHREIDEMHDEIVKILNKNQKEKWEKRFRRFHRLLPPAEEK